MTTVIPLGNLIGNWHTSEKDTEPPEAAAFGIGPPTGAAEEED